MFCFKIIKIICAVQLADMTGTFLLRRNRIFKLNLLNKMCLCYKI